MSNVLETSESICVCFSMKLLYWHFQEIPGKTQRPSPWCIARCLFAVSGRPPCSSPQRPWGCCICFSSPSLSLGGYLRLARRQGWTFPGWACTSLTTLASRRDTRCIGCVVSMATIWRTQPLVQVVLACTLGLAPELRPSFARNMRCCCSLHGMRDIIICTDQVDIHPQNTRHSTRLRDMLCPYSREFRSGWPFRLEVLTESRMHYSSLLRTRVARTSSFRKECWSRSRYEQVNVSADEVVLPSSMCVQQVWFTRLNRYWVRGASNCPHFSKNKQRILFIRW